MGFADMFFKVRQDKRLRQQKESQIGQVDKQLDLQGKRDRATERQNIFKNFIEKLKFNVGMVKDKDQPDAFRLDRANDYNRMVGLPIIFTDITEIDKVERIFEKQANLIKRYEKGEFSSDTLKKSIRGLQVEYNVALGSSDAFAPAVKTAEEQAEKEKQNKVFRLSEVFRRAASGERPDLKNAEFVARIKQSNSPESQEIIRLATQMAREGTGGGRDFKIHKDEMGNLIGIDPRTLERFPVPRQGVEQPPITRTEETQPQGQPFLEAQELTKSTGPLSFSANFLAGAFGWLKPGEQFSGTKEAQNKVNNLNRQITQTLILSKRYPVFEQKLIQGFLVEPGKFWADPGSAAGKMLDLKEFITQKRESLQSQLSQNISAESRKEISTDIINIGSVLGFLPSDLGLKVAARRAITIDDIRVSSIIDLKKFPKSGLKLLSKEVKIEMIKRLEVETSNTSGSF